jgi:spoIIIJ-associated protein
VEWVETTGRTVEEAKDAALDRLGVDERDAEFDVVEEARSGLFGRVRQEARVRVRVRPDQPRPRVDRRDRRRRGAPAANDGDAGATTPENADASVEAKAETSGDRGRIKAPVAPSATHSRDDDDDDIPGPTAAEIGEQARVFLDGLAEAFDVDAEAEVELLDDITVEARLTGDDLGLLIGPKGQTLAAVQDLTRAAVQHGPRRGARLRVDVGGYQQRRREALARFTNGVAAQVLASRTPVSMEPMPAIDRKVVHDTVNTVDGVVSRSEGEDPRRRVVIAPDDAD